MIPEIWVNDELSLEIDKECLRTHDLKRDIAKSFGLGNLEILLEDIKEPTITEYLSSEFCKVSGREDLREVSPLLQSFISYLISAHDFITDEHYFKLGRPTFLKTHGADYLKEALNNYSKIVSFLGKKVENKGIQKGHERAISQVEKTIEGDKLRNTDVSKSMVTPQKAIGIQEFVAGGTARYLAELSGGGDIEQEMAYHLVNSICTLEDLMHFSHSTDLIEPKATIPLAYLGEEVKVSDFKKVDVKKVGQRAVDKTGDYLLNQLKKFEHNLHKTNRHSNLSYFSDSIRKFIKQYL